MLNLILNPMAGRGKSVSEAAKVTARLDMLGVSHTVHHTKYKMHASELAERLVLDGAETIVSCGGDGTIHEIVNGMMRAKSVLAKSGGTLSTRLGLLPMGTGNDFMRSAALPTELFAATDIVLRGNASPIDTICVDGIYEISFACKGIDIDVVNMVNASKRKTSSSYLKKALICIFKGVNYDFRLVIDGKEISDKGIIAAVLNGGQLAGGMHFCPIAKIDDGLMDVIFVKKRGISKTLQKLASLTGDSFIDGDMVTHYTAQHVEIFTNQAIADIDGELYDKKEFDAVIAPNSLMLIR